MSKIKLQSKETFDNTFKLTGEYDVIAETKEYIIVQDPDSKETFVLKNWD